MTWPCFNYDTFLMETDRNENQEKNGRVAETELFVFLTHLEAEHFIPATAALFSLNADFFTLLKIIEVDNLT